MGEIITSWLRSRLGVIIDLTPEIFGRYCRDGTFLAKLLHSYDIINDSQLNTITQTSDPALARVNLRHLRVWLRFIGVDCHDQCIEDISNGKGTAALHLFYKVFLCLENKDRLHFITLQKEREKYLPTTTKFDVKIVPEDTLDSELSNKFPTKSNSWLEWYEKKMTKKITKINNEPEEERVESSVVSEVDKSIVNTMEVEKKQNEMTELDEFAKKFNTDDSLRKTVHSPQLHVNGNPMAAERSIAMLKMRKHKEAEMRNLKLQMQKLLLSQVWEKIEYNEEREVDRAIARKILRQSQYEKQLVKKLCDIRNERIRIANNRQLVEEQVQKTRESDARIIADTVREDSVRKNEQINDECRRINELLERMKLQKLQRYHRKLETLAVDAVNDLVDISVAAAEFKCTNNNFIPEHLWNEWRVLFLNKLSIFESDKFTIDCTKEVDGNGGVKFNFERANILNEKDFDDYHNMIDPWNLSRDVIDPKSDKYYKSGLIVMGYIVHKIMEITNSQLATLKHEFSDKKVRVAIDGLTNSSLYERLRDLLEQKNIQLVCIESAINYCLQCYKEQIKDTECNRNKSMESDELIKQTNGTSVRVDDENIIDNTTEATKLSEAGVIGRWINQFTIHGEPISDQLIAHTTVVYLKSLTDIDGWVLVNYPKTYSQLSYFEYHLSGRKLPELTKDTRDIDQLEAPKITYDFEDSFSSKWISKLLPYPQQNTEDHSNVSSTLTKFIKIIPNVNVEDENSRKISQTSLDEFLTGQGIQSIVHFSTDSSILEEIIASIEDTSSSAVAVTMEKIEQSPENTEFRDTNASQDSTTPGELNWKWINLIQSNESIDSLAELWKNVEHSYINGLREVLSLKRFNSSSIGPYNDFIRDYMIKFIRRPDDKQSLVQQFQRAFNAIPEDTRDDDDMKCELYYRVTEFQTELWDICNTRRHTAVKECNKIIEQQWTSMQAICLINIYIDILEIEMNRCVDTLKFIEDYYLSMLQLPIELNKLVKIKLHKLTSSFDSTINNNNESSASVKKNKKSKNSILSPPLPLLQEKDLKNQIMDMLSNNDGSFENICSSCFKIIQANISYCQSIINNISTSTIDTLMEEKNNLLTKRRSGRRKKSNFPSNTIIRDCFLEWEYVFMFEINRIHRRLLIVENNGKVDIDYLLKCMQRTFLSIHESINERYNSEMQCVNEIIKIFFMSIEQGKSMSEEIIFTPDGFSIRSNALLFQDISRSPYESDDCHFTINQLVHLKDIFQRVAPGGSISFYSFVYILQDLIVCRDEDNTILPSIWYELTANSVTQLTHQVFGNVNYIDWKEFFIYALNIKMPSDDELLDAKAAYEEIDRDFNQIIDKEQFISITLWFDNSDASLKYLNDYKQTQKVLDEELPKVGRMKAESGEKLKKPKKSISFSANITNQSDRDQSKKRLSTDIRNDPLKELLSEIFHVNHHTVNYMEMLRLFCKDVDPKLGIAKAFSLALDGKVCSFDEGEKYVENIYEEKHRADVEEERISIDEDPDSGGIMELHAETSSTMFNRSFRKSGPILIEQLDESGEAIDPASLLIEESHLNINYNGLESYYSMENIDEFSLLSSENDEDLIKKREIVYWLPRQVCESVLLSSIPSVIIEKNIADTGMSFEENLKSIYREIQCDGLNGDDNNTALVHRVINHKFIVKLLKSTEKFTWKNLNDILMVNTIMYKSE